VEQKKERTIVERALYGQKPVRRVAKITLAIALAIIAVRTTFDLSTARIQPERIALPDYATEAIPYGVHARIAAIKNEY
jgi:hypothetical protein